jgi:hypothetical protein
MDRLKLRNLAKIRLKCLSVVTELEINKVLTHIIACSGSESVISTAGFVGHLIIW